MHFDELVSHHPQLFHMAQAGSWPAIRDNGLLTTEHIVTTANLDAADQKALLHHRRRDSFSIEHPVLGQVVIRDQRPMNVANLTLDDLTLEQWLHELNSRVFFWLHPAKLDQLLNARLYRSLEQDVLTVDTASLIAAVGDRAQLSPINSGANIYPNSRPRGSEIFTEIRDYDYKARRRARGPVNAIVELAVLDGVPDIRDHVTEVRRMRGSTVLGMYES